MGIRLLLPEYPKNFPPQFPSVIVPPFQGREVKLPRPCKGEVGEPQRTGRGNLVLGGGLGCGVLGVWVVLGSKTSPQFPLVTGPLPHGEGTRAAILLNVLLHPEGEAGEVRTG